MWHGGDAGVVQSWGCGRHGSQMCRGRGCGTAGPWRRGGDSGTWDVGVQCGGDGKESCGAAETCGEDGDTGRTEKDRGRALGGSVEGMEKCLVAQGEREWRGAPAGGGANGEGAVGGGACGTPAVTPGSALLPRPRARAELCGGRWHISAS